MRDDFPPGPITGWSEVAGAWSQTGWTVSTSDNDAVLLNDVSDPGGDWYIEVPIYATVAGQEAAIYLYSDATAANYVRIKATFGDPLAAVPCGEFDVEDQGGTSQLSTPHKVNGLVAGSAHTFEVRKIGNVVSVAIWNAYYRQEAKLTLSSADRVGVGTVDAGGSAMQFWWFYWDHMTAGADVCHKPLSCTVFPDFDDPYLWKWLGATWCDNTTVVTSTPADHVTRATALYDTTQWNAENGCVVRTQVNVNSSHLQPLPGPPLQYIETSPTVWLRLGNAEAIWEWSAPYGSPQHVDLTQTIKVNGAVVATETIVEWDRNIPAALKHYDFLLSTGDGAACIQTNVADAMSALTPPIEAGPIDVEMTPDTIPLPAPRSYILFAHAFNCEVCDVSL